MEVRYLAANADIKEGDTIVTSGVGGCSRPACRWPRSLRSSVTPPRASRAPSASRWPIPNAIATSWSCRWMWPAPNPTVRRSIPVDRTNASSPRRRLGRQQRPARAAGRAGHGVFVWASIILVWLVSLLPWRLWQGAPDVLILIIAFWCAHEPPRRPVHRLHLRPADGRARRRPAGRARAVHADRLWRRGPAAPPAALRPVEPGHAHAAGVLRRAAAGADHPRLAGGQVAGHWDWSAPA